MAKVRISTMGQERREVDFTEGETLQRLFDRLQIDVPRGNGIEIWVNGEKVENASAYVLRNDDAIVLMPNLKGAQAS